MGFESECCVASVRRHDKMHCLISVLNLLDSLTAIIFCFLSVTLEGNHRHQWDSQPGHIVSDTCTPCTRQAVEVCLCEAHEAFYTQPCALNAVPAAVFKTAQQYKEEIDHSRTGSHYLCVNLFMPETKHIHTMMSMLLSLVWKAGCVGIR